MEYPIPVQVYHVLLLILNPLLVDREIVCQSFHKEPNANEHATDGLEGTISYEVALKKEIEFQKRVKEAFLQPSATTRLPRTPSWELPPEQSLTRKMTYGIQLEPAPHEHHSRKEPPNDRQTASPKLHLQQTSLKPLEHCGPSTQQSQSRNHSSQQLNSSQPPDQGFKYRTSFQQNLQYQPPFCRPAQNQQTLPREFNNQAAAPNQDATPSEKKMWWCNECNVPCMNEMSLAQHRAGKKHARHARLLLLLANYGASGAAVAGEASGTVHAYGFKNVEPQRKTGGTLNIGPQ